MGKPLKSTFVVMGLMVLGAGCTRSGLDVPANAAAQDSTTFSDSTTDAPRPDVPPLDSVGDLGLDFLGGTTPDSSVNHFLRFSREQDYVRLDSELDWGVDFSVALKIRLAAIPEAYKDYLTCFGHDSSSSTLSGWELGFGAAGKPRWWIANQDADPFPKKCEMSAEKGLVVDTWHLITFVFHYSESASADVTLYVDGDPVTQSSVASCQQTMAPGPLPSDSFRLGGMDEVQLDVDDLQLFDRALSPLEVEQLAVGNFSSGRVLYWRMDEGGGAVLGDASGNGNTGTLHNSAWGAH